MSNNHVELIKEFYGEAISAFFRHIAEIAETKYAFLVHQCTQKDTDNSMMANSITFDENDNDVMRSLITLISLDPRIWIDEGKAKEYLIQIISEVIHVQAGLGERYRFIIEPCYVVENEERSYQCKISPATQ